MTITLTAQDIQTVRNTWKIFRQIDPQLIGEIFYGKLFSEHPGLRKLFPKEMQAQHQKLVDMLSSIIVRLEHPDSLAKDLAALGQRHKTYKVEDAYYPFVGEALLWTIRQGLGPDWDEEVEKAWSKCYQFMVAGMKS